jgi:hypothetical protein
MLDVRDIDLHAPDGDDEPAAAAPPPPALLGGT